ncbi:hypothetical protein HPB51_014096 [Rhipicephalus microplus]|uniref:Elongation of very long chain fatty acids protein n=1 Tax=Rhipicephalus microplus TaxID=6941 RepID=A0A9J6DUJ1_RHIMP|nr:hypothetical protein HPB51_014096 [Rhipicephalus microplus]
MATASMTANSGFPFYQPQDPRTAHWYFLGNKTLITLLIVSYVYIVKVGGPRFMKNRKPYDGIKPLIILYNAFMVVGNAYYVYAFFTAAYIRKGYSPICQGIDFNARDEDSMALLSLGWSYSMFRILDFLDTYLLRAAQEGFARVLAARRASQCGRLQWVVRNSSRCGRPGDSLRHGKRVRARGDVHVLLSQLSGTPDAEVLVVEALHYAAATYAVRGSLCAHLMPLFFNCNYPRVHTYVSMAEAIFFFSLFMNFYVKTYRAKKVRVTKKSVVNGKIL